MPPMLPARTRRRLAALATLAALAGACAPDRAVTGSTYPYDVRARHPIVLTDGSRKLDVFIVGSGALNPRQREDVLAFVAEYRRYGQGPIAAQIPSGGKTDGYAHRTLDSIRGALAERCSRRPSGGLELLGRGPDRCVQDPPVVPAPAGESRFEMRALAARPRGKRSALQLWQRA